MTRYAAETSVSVEKSRMEIERTLARYGADAFAYFAEAARAMIAFRIGQRQIKFVLALPDRSEREFTHTPAEGRARSADAAEKAWEQACRQRWRALALVIKAKLEAAHQKAQDAARGWNKRLGVRPDDAKSAPLCAWHHRLGPNRCDPAQAKFWAGLGIDVIAFCEALFSAFREGRNGAEVVEQYSEIW